MKQILMPKLSEAMTEAKFLCWLVEPGTLVRKGDLIAEVETDKANMDIEALEDGIIGPLYAHPGDMIPAGNVLADFATTASDGSASYIG